MQSGWKNALKETGICSGLYLLVSVFTFELLMPIQSVFFPEFPSRASLLFLPHGVKVLSAWLLGWRAVPALLPGVFLLFWMIAGVNVLAPSRLFAMAVAVGVAPLVFHALAAIGWDVRPRKGVMPCWSCVMVVGVLVSVIGAYLTNTAFGSSTTDFFAYLIGDFFGLFFLMLALMYAFRLIRKLES